VGRYKGRVKGWDVVNEALTDNGAMRDSPWRTNIGNDFILKAYQFAHEADPAAELYYNDYSLEKPEKRQGAIALINQLQGAGIKVAAVGLQDHLQLKSPTIAQLEETIDAFAALGVKVMITELDLDVLPPVRWSAGVALTNYPGAPKEMNPYTNGLPETVQQQAADRYSELFLTLLKHEHDISRVTFWGVTDAQSWLNNWPVKGRTAYPLLFDRAGKPKPAFYAVVNAASITKRPSAQAKTETEKRLRHQDSKVAQAPNGPVPSATASNP
jgi:endo-1,4-beta-xylanase